MEVIQVEEADGRRLAPIIEVTISEPGRIGGLGVGPAMALVAALLEAVALVQAIDETEGH